MNIIANNCIGARLYQITKKQFPNPFMWMTFSSIDDYVKLIENYDNIDLNNPTFELETYKENKHKSVLVTLDNDIKLHYIHYIQDDTKDNPVKESNTNILYKDILTYSKEKWFKRVNRINEEPIFLYSFNNLDINNTFYLKLVNKILNINTKYKIIILIHKSYELRKSIPKNINIIRLSDKEMKLTTSELANLIKTQIFTNE